MKQETPTLQQLLNSAGIKRRFEELLDNSAPSFVSSILTIVRSNSKLQDCSPNSILSASVLTFIVLVGVALIGMFAIHRKRIAPAELGRTVFGRRNE